MIRSKYSIRAALLAGGIGLSVAGFAGLQPAAGQSYSDGYACPGGYVYDPAYGCTLTGDASEPYDFGYYGYLPYGEPYYGGHREFGHGLGHGMAGGFSHGIGGGFDHGAGFAHAGGFGHGMAGGFHGGGGGHR